MFRFSELFSSRQMERTTTPMQVPVVINTEDDYALAVARIKDLEFELDSPSDDAEFVAITEAMLKYEMRKSAYSDEN